MMIEQDSKIRLCGFYHRSDGHWVVKGICSTGKMVERVFDDRENANILRISWCSR